MGTDWTGSGCEPPASPTSQSTIPSEAEAVQEEQETGGRTAHAAAAAVRGPLTKSLPGTKSSSAAAGPAERQAHTAVEPQPQADFRQFNNSRQRRLLGRKDTLPLDIEILSSQGSASAQSPDADAQDPGHSHRSSGCSSKGRSSSHFAEVQYNVYNARDYDIVWMHYAYIYPIWDGDFGKTNLSASSTLQATVVVSMGCCRCCASLVYVKVKV